MLVLGDRDGERAVEVLPVGQQFVERARIDHRAGEDMGADLRAFFEDADGNLAAGLGGELLQADGGGEAGGAGADDHHVIRHRLPVGHSLLRHSCRRKPPTVWQINSSYTIDQPGHRRLKGARFRGGKDFMSSDWAASALSWWEQAGVDVIVGEAPRDWLNPGTKAPAPPPEPARAQMPAALDAFRDWLASTETLPFATPSAPRVGPAGDPASGLMMLTDMPGDDDAAAGTLLSGEVGALFDRMLAAIGRSRDTIYLAAFSPIRPPAGRIDDESIRALADIARHHVGLACAQGAAAVRRRLLAGAGRRADDAGARPLARGRDPAGPVKALVTTEAPGIAAAAGAEGACLGRPANADGGAEAMTRLSGALTAMGLALAATPAYAEDTIRPAPTAPLHGIAAPAQLGASERDNYRAVFASLRAQDWAGAAGRLDGMREGPLHNLARAMLYTMPGSPRVELQPLADLIARAPELPQAGDLARLARARGAEALPELPDAQRLVGLAGQPRRARPRPIRGDEVADALEPLIQPLIVADQAYEAETLLATRIEELSDEARTAFQQRIAWVYYLNGNDREARRLADLARRGPTEYGIHAEWVAGLAAWRMGDHDAAAGHFGTVGARSGDVELAAAGHYWAARADTAGARPERVQARLRTAARHAETFYGLLAQSMLALRQPPADMTSLTAEDWRALSGLANVRAAVALGEIGENDLADELIRHQARIGSPGDHAALIHLAARLNLTATQMWLAHNGPRGSRFGPRERYPQPELAAGARLAGRPLARLRPRPAGIELPARRGQPGRRARADAGPPRHRRRHGPRPRRGLQRRPAQPAGGQHRIWPDLSRISAGPVEHRRAAAQGDRRPTMPGRRRSPSGTPRYDQSDPLLYIESLPYWETRGYVPIILRNYWIYEARSGDQSASRRALAQGMWPRFPGLSGPSAVRIAPRSRQTAMGGD